MVNGFQVVVHGKKKLAERGPEVVRHPNKPNTRGGKREKFDSVAFSGTAAFVGVEHLYSCVRHCSAALPLLLGLFFFRVLDFQRHCRFVFVVLDLSHCQHCWVCK